MDINFVADNLNKYKPMAMYFAKNEMLADDVLQEVFIKINRRRERDGNLDFLAYKDGMNESYIFLMVRSCYIDIIRKESKYADMPTNSLDFYGEMSPVGTEEPKEPDILSHHLTGLSWYDKKLTEIYFTEEHTIRSLAAATNISATNVFLTLKKTKKHIKNNIDMEIKDEITAYVKQKAKSKKSNKKSANKPSAKSRGLGDSVEKLTKATGIKKIVDSLFDDCGCDKRKELLNKLFPYKHPKCMTEGQYNDWKDALDKIQLNRIEDSELKTIARLHSEIFQHKYFEPCRCEPKSWKNLIVDINKIYKTYEDELQTS